MEITKKEKKTQKRGRFIWLLILAVAVLIVGIWQYRLLIVEVTDGVATDVYRGVLHPFKQKGSLSHHSLRVALIQSEYTAASFGDKRDNYYKLINIWERILEHEGFGYHKLTEIPVGKDIENYNLIVLPSASCLSREQGEAVKKFLKAGKGVVMTWACGTRNEYGQWKKYSLLQEIGGMEIVSPPAATEKNVSTAMLSGGYPITASLAAGFHLDVTSYDDPISCHVREDRVMIDGVWIDSEAPSFGLHGIRDRVAVAHGDYLGGRFVWMGFSVGSSRETPSQRSAFFSMVKKSMLWAGHQVQAFRPVWPKERSCVVAITQNIYGPDDVNPRLVALLRKHRVPVTSFVVPNAMQDYPKRMEMLTSLGEVSLLGDPAVDYRALSLSDQKKHFKEAKSALEKLTGQEPKGFRPAAGQEFSQHTLDALVRTGFNYISTEEYDRIVPKAVRSYRKAAFITAPDLLWLMPEMGYIVLDDKKDKTPISDMEHVISKEAKEENTMLSHFAQINALNGLYCLSVKPSAVDFGFVDRLGELLSKIERNNVLITTAEGVIDEWSQWDQLKMTTRHLSATRTSLKISNTGRHKVKDIMMYIELPRIMSKLDIESMTLGTALPSSMSNDGIRWKLHLDELGAGKNVTYFLDMPQNDQINAPASPTDGEATE